MQKTALNFPSLRLETAPSLQGNPPLYDSNLGKAVFASPQLIAYPPEIMKGQLGEKSK